jgi:hypothetical protein
MVKWTGKLVVLALTLLLWAMPLMACMLPDASLTVAERECCKDMAGQCDQMHMPTSHSCCQLTVRQSDPYVFCSRFTQEHVQTFAASLVSCRDLFLAAAASRIDSSAQTHSPPVSPPETVSILRI